MLVVPARKGSVPVYDYVTQLITILFQAIYQDSNSYKKMPSRTVEDGIEMLDSMLVAAERTLSEQQKIAISSSLSSCWSPVYVNILFHQAKSWRSNDIVNVPPKV